MLRVTPHLVRRGRKPPRSPNRFGPCGRKPNGPVADPGLAAGAEAGGLATCATKSDQLGSVEGRGAAKPSPFAAELPRAGEASSAWVQAQPIHTPPRRQTRKTRGVDLPIGPTPR